MAGAAQRSVGVHESLLPTEHDDTRRFVRIRRLALGATLTFAMILGTAAVIYRSSFGPELMMQRGRAEMLSESNDDAVPWLQISGGPPAPPRDLRWIARVCTPLYEGPDCANVTTWKGKVTLQLGGVTIKNVHMHTRGHASAMFPKHQFSFKLPTPISLLGMAPARKWVLATSFVDTSFQRNPTAFDMYRQLGGFATKTKYVNVNWGGNDYGLYYIGERVEPGPGRLDIPAAQPENPAASGYLLTVDWAKPGKLAVQSSNTSTYFSVVYPAKKDISTMQELFLRKLIDSVDASAATDFSRPGTTPLENIVDFPSFARYFIIEELAKDVDGYAFSNFVMVRDGRLFHAAPWDFDLGFGFACMPVYYTNAFTGKVSFGVSGWNVENLRDNALWVGKDGMPGSSVWKFGMNKRQLFLNIWKQPKFKAEFARLWSRARQGPLSDDMIADMVASRSLEIRSSAKRDLALWSKSNRTGFWTSCAPDTASSFVAAQAYLLQYLRERAHWIDSNIGELVEASALPLLDDTFPM